MPEIPNAKIARSRLGNIIRFRSEDAEAIVCARKRLAAAKLRDAVIRVVNADPLPSDEQLDEIINILASSKTNSEATPRYSDGASHA